MKVHLIEGIDTTGGNTATWIVGVCYSKWTALICSHLLTLTEEDVDIDYHLLVETLNKLGQNNEST